MTEQITRVLLIDLENCPSQIHQLMSDLQQYSQVVVCYAQSGAKIPIDWIMPLTVTINDNKLKLVKMPIVGKNSADFGITFWAGVLMAQLPPETHFDIVSNDTDLDYVVSLLISQQRSAERVGIKKENPSALTEIKTTATKIPSSETQDHYLRVYCLHLLNHSKPAKKETLLNSVRAKFKADNIDTTLLVETLVKQGVITINENKIAYNQQKLNQFANSI
ncbi:MAG: PIN domain-containing protein [Methylococcaceae bacterium]|nr:PIN domain-containing protein [Methylococcaceae bacterium]